VKRKFLISNSQFPFENREGDRGLSSIANRKSQIANLTAFTLIEVMVVMALLSLIVIALMTVFNSTQAAFRASVTQTDVLESGRAAMEMISDDLRAMTPSLGVSNSAPNPLQNGLIPVNFYVVSNTVTAPLIQPLIGSISGQARISVVQSFFVLSRNNQTWTGTGYYVDTSSTSAINPFYRFSMSTNVSAINGPAMLYYNFLNSALTNSPPWSHLLDGVVGLRLRAYGLDGNWLTNRIWVTPGLAGKNTTNSLQNAVFFSPYLGEIGYYMFSNTLPAAVEIELATLEDHTLQRASTWPNNSLAQSNYLSQQAGKVHVFRQRVAIPNVDSSVYQ
jgi:type II secretory pathway pseudopilin PulG